MSIVYENPGAPVPTPDKPVTYVDVKFYTLETIQATETNGTQHVSFVLRGWDTAMENSVPIAVELKGASATQFFNATPDGTKSWWENTVAMTIDAAKAKGKIPGDVAAV